MRDMEPTEFQKQIPPFYSEHRRLLSPPGADGVKPKVVGSL
jgi:hypothetical protein